MISDLCFDLEVFQNPKNGSDFCDGREEFIEMF